MKDVTREYRADAQALMDALSSLGWTSGSGNVTPVGVDVGLDVDIGYRVAGGLIPFITLGLHSGPSVKSEVQASGGGATLSVTRDLATALYPVTLGVEYQLQLGRRFWLAPRATVGTGNLVVTDAVSVENTSNGYTNDYSVGYVGSGVLYTAEAEFGIHLGIGSITCLTANPTGVSAW